MKNFPDTDKTKFHTATQDVEISAKIMKKVKETAKPIFDSSLLTTSKQKARDVILNNLLFTTVLYYFGKVDLSLALIFLITQFLLVGLLFFA